LPLLLTTPWVLSIGLLIGAIEDIGIAFQGGDSFFASGAKWFLDNKNKPHGETYQLHRRRALASGIALGGGGLGFIPFGRPHYAPRVPARFKDTNVSTETNINLLDPKDLSGVLEETAAKDLFLVKGVNKQMRD
jgi:hypothetical protein